MEARAHAEAAAAAALPAAKAAAARASELIKQDDAAAAREANSSSSDESSGDEIEVDMRRPTAALDQPAAIKMEEDSHMSDYTRAGRGLSTPQGTEPHSQQDFLMHNGNNVDDRGGQASVTAPANVKEEQSDPEEQATHHGEIISNSSNNGSGIT